MLKTLSLVLFVGGMFLVGVAFDRNDATAQALAGAAGAARPRELVLDLGDQVKLKLVQIPAGKFLMGSPRDEEDREDDEGLPPGQWVNGSPQIEVTISKAFYLGVYEVTVDQYAQFMKETGTRHEAPSFKQAGDHPVVNASWEDAQAFCQWLSKKSGRRVVLPTEAQWEYACRAGSKTRFNFGDKDEDLGGYAWFDDESTDKDNAAAMTHPVGKKKPNAWGLYDMHGNAWEWCADLYGDYTGVAVDPAGPKVGGMRVQRGGSWGSPAVGCRTARRNRRGADDLSVRNGLRVAVVAAAADVDPR